MTGTRVTARPPDLTRLLWLIPLFLALHNLEEALTMRRTLSLMQAGAPQILSPFIAQLTYAQMLTGLVFVTVLPLLVTLWAVRKPASNAALWSVLAIQAVVALNVGSHAVVAAQLGGYGPGLATALAINLPFSVYLFERATQEQWLSRRALLALIPAAVVLHGPALIGLILLGGVIARH